MRSPADQRHPDSYRPTDEQILERIRRQPLITLIELALAFWAGVPWRAPRGTDSLTATLRRWPGHDRPCSAARWLYVRLLKLSVRGLIHVQTPCCKRKQPCTFCLGTAVFEPLQDLTRTPSNKEEGAQSIIEIDGQAVNDNVGPDSTRRAAVPEQSVTATVQVEGRRPLVVVLSGALGRVSRETRTGLRRIGGLRLMPDDHGIQVVAQGLQEVEIAAIEDYLTSQDRPRLAPQIELLLQGLENNTAVHERPRCPSCLTLDGLHGVRCPVARPSGLLVGPIDESVLDAVLDGAEVGHA